MFRQLLHTEKMLGSCARANGNKQQREKKTFHSVKVYIKYTDFQLLYTKVVSNNVGIV
jgi:hypothetical protein